MWVAVSTHDLTLVNLLLNYFPPTSIDGSTYSVKLGAPNMIELHTPVGVKDPTIHTGGGFLQGVDSASVQFPLGLSVFSLPQSVLGAIGMTVPTHDLTLSYLTQ